MHFYFARSASLSNEQIWIKFISPTKLNYTAQKQIDAKIAIIYNKRLFLFLEKNLITISSMMLASTIQRWN